jgi:hypothetical protein
MGNVQRTVFGPSILYLGSTLNTESENISIDYDSIRHVFETIPNKSLISFFLKISWIKWFHQITCDNTKNRLRNKWQN